MTTPADWVTAFLERAADGLDIDRLVESAPGVDATTVGQVLGDERLGTHVIEAMSDLMHPTDSMYFDAIFGAFDGQVAIRNWLVPTMSDISFIEFVPGAPTAGERVAVDRRRPMLASTLLGIIAVGHIACGVMCFLSPLETKAGLPGMADVSPWLWSWLAICCIVDGLLVMVLLGWQKWGLLALCVMAFLEAALIHYAGAPAWVTIGTLVLAVIGIALVYGIAKLGGQYSLWAQSE